MKTFEDFLDVIDDDHKERVKEILVWIKETYPNLVPVIKWNQPMFTDHDTYIIGMSVSKKHIGIAPEAITILHFLEDIKQSGYKSTDNLFRIQWKDAIDYTLLTKIIDFNIADKKDSKTFWRT